MMPPNMGMPQMMGGPSMMAPMLVLPPAIPASSASLPTPAVEKSTTMFVGSIGEGIEDSFIEDLLKVSAFASF